ncbi:MAG: hypothetical protein K0A98_15670 [Trueperaceae bacterium]|nr:hypothetical protein [Trueperaceae bacterium]
MRRRLGLASRVRSVTFVRHRPLAVAAFALATLLGCGGPAPGPTITVQGRVEVPLVGPLANVLVHLQGTLTATAADGTFLIEDVTVPYTVTIGAAGSEPWVHAFEGLTTPTPVLVPRGAPAVGFFTVLRGDVSGGAQLPDDEMVLVCVEGVEVPVLGCGRADGGATAYAAFVAWTGATAVSVRVHALRMRVTPAGWPTAYLGRSSYAPMTLTHLLEAQRNVVPIGPMGDIFDVEGAVTVAGGGVLELVVVGVPVSDTLSLPVYRGPWPAGETTIAVPDYGGAGFHVAAHGAFGDQNARAWAAFAAGETFALSLPTPPVPVSPDVDAPGVTAATPFTVLADAAMARQFHWVPTITGSAPEVTLTTASTTAYLPDVAALGMSLVVGNNYFWDVTSIHAADLATATRVAGVDGFAFGMGGPGPGTRAGTAAGEARRFTLAP